MNSKPRILLIPNVAWWIVGEMGKQIIARFANKYEFYFLPEGLLERRPALLRSLAPAVDAIHCLNESSIGLFRSFDRAILPPIATWIHHVTTWSPDHQRAADWSSALTVCTPAWKRYLEQRISGQLRVTVIPHGVDTDFFRRRKVDCKRFAIPPGRFVLGFIGNKNSDSDGGRKGTDTFLRVVRQVAARVPNLHVVLGGPGWDKELMWLTASGISASATGFIRTADLPLLYSALDVYLLTSRVEGGPCTVLEAMACETAVVSTRVGFVPDILVDGLNGYSADVDDCHALSSAIVELEQSAPKRVAIATAARQTISARSWKSVLSPLESVYDGLVEERRKSGLPLPGPTWMNNPQRLFHASCAADALANVVPQVRKGTISTAKGIAQLREMLYRQSAIDITNGAGMLVGATFRTGRSSAP